MIATATDAHRAARQFVRPDSLLPRAVQLGALLAGADHLERVGVAGAGGAAAEAEGRDVGVPPGARLVVLLVVALVEVAAGRLFAVRGVRVDQDVVLAGGAALPLQDDGLGAARPRRRAQDVVADHGSPETKRGSQIGLPLPTLLHRRHRSPLAGAHLALLMRRRPLRAVLVDGALVEAARLQLLLNLRPHLAEVAQVPRHQLQLVAGVP